MHYVALTWLKEDGSGLGELALRLGYQSEAAFSRAFSGRASRARTVRGFFG
jgi:AraC-like DNA-binding protein